MSKFYVVTRQDLSEGLQASQLLHAARVFQNEHPLIEEVWYRESNTVVLLTVPGVEQLVSLLDGADRRGIASSCFVDEDLGCFITAVAFEPGQAASELCRGLKLAFKEKICTDSSAAERRASTPVVAGSIPALCTVKERIRAWFKEIRG